MIEMKHTGYWHVFFDEVLDDIDYLFVVIFVCDDRHLFKVEYSITDSPLDGFHEKFFVFPDEVLVILVRDQFFKSLEIGRNFQIILN
jgi:hypothetical protein